MQYLRKAFNNNNPPVAADVYRVFGTEVRIPEDTDPAQVEDAIAQAAGLTLTQYNALKTAIQNAQQFDGDAVKALPTAGEKLDAVTNAIESVFIILRWLAHERSV